MKLIEHLKLICGFIISKIEVFSLDPLNIEQLVLDHIIDHDIIEEAYCDQALNIVSHIKLGEPEGCTVFNHVFVLVPFKLLIFLTS